ncbi:hypothetical protein GDO86_003491 [Hymenochirus boettgeri]|uniref:UBX domain-containing protein 11 n=1 Tax=Hymenochirus boettgeri TaxID=247094 RepID=A0A8T2K3U5_9PIPI|nr:hypothetical protein GDO86_003491 [Hymenochirus boettgeri]
MSNPLVTLGRPRKTRIALSQQSSLIPEPSVPERGQLSTRRPMQEGRVCGNSGDGRRPAPFKAKTHYTEEELILLGSLSLNPTEPPNKGNSFLLERAVQGSAPSDSELLNSAMKRVIELERIARAQEQDIKIKDLEIKALEKKINRMQQHHTENTIRGQRELDLEENCKKLHQKICEMEHFLSDYGLVWVGENDEASSFSTARSWNPDISAEATFQPDFDLILENIKDLNVLGGEGESHIEYQKRGARLKAPESVQLTIYKNGIIMFQGPFRSYQEKSTQQCMKDIMDGYFPSELQNHFPNGVIFQVTDNRDVTFSEKRPWDEFPGPGHTVGSLEGNIQETTKKPGLQLSTNQFLNRLPKSVARGGQLVEIRESIREALQGPVANEIPREILLNSPHLELEQSYSPPKNKVILTLRIRSETGEETYKVRMLSSETFGDLRKYLSQCRYSFSDFFSLRFFYKIYKLSFTLS